MAFLENPFFPASCSVSFLRSISSDHVALFLDLPLTSPPPAPPCHMGWIIKDQMEEDWKRAFSKFSPPLITDIPSLSRVSTDLINLTHNTCNRFFTQKKTHRNRGLAWWNDTCKIAATDVSRAHRPECRRLSSVLWATI